MLTALTGVHGDRADAVTVAGRTASYEELLGAARQVAADLAESGIPAFAVTATASLETVAAVVGALLAGVPCVPLPPDAGPAERGHILRDSGARPLDVDFARRSDKVPAPADVRTPEDPALILYTSGTTGAPKGVVLSSAAITADLDALAEAWQWNAGDTLVHGLPLFHVHGLVLGVLGALRTGSRLVHTGRPTPEAYAAAGGSLYFGVPTVWSRIARDPHAAAALSGARLLVSGSAALPAPVFRDIERASGHRIVERYGMTETLITVSGRAGGDLHPGTVGTPLPGIATRVAAEDGAEIGELQLTGPTLFSGYLGRPEATAAAYTEDGWFRTGDIAAVDEKDGVHRIVGRASTDMIKSGGYRIGAGEIENALLDHPRVREAAVVGVPDADLGQRIVAFVVAEGVTGAELTDFVAAHLSVHKRPREVRFVEAIPRNAMGKPQKRLLLDGAAPDHG
ncbi:MULTISPECIES: acyl-CoA synthetase [Streptomyces]|uniref:acyl-CoA synthetase n=1 Tax=Streptomyces TaxID=1883 RepID=UPI0006AF1D0F|nr:MULTISPECIES: acyl-CoA synthetase [unclassified Streptomyces]KOU75569.1 acyl-CoA synthetase [Streptomyces sp. IGB124]KOU78769.1 acyl-CoA synthetase [Streptomyces sp. XY58]KOU88657.1 acyl-CoA synthetase [Streptomyces sp. XY66]KOV02765.1 acyl-CoA synthetase [Streptomyces sp. XY37]KOV41155.1 acyl-CoA synthetase [Streptomyces sp. MMG1064]